MSLLETLSQRRTVRCYDDTSVSAQALKNLLWAGQGITAPDGKRTAPSAYALHPLKLHVCVSRVTGYGIGLYDVDALDQTLKHINRSNGITVLQKAVIGNPQWVAKAACHIIVSAETSQPIQVFADQKPFGARGMRYVYLEAGAALQNMQLQAVTEGLGSVLVGGFDDDAVAEILQLDSSFAPIAILCVGHPSSENKQGVAELD